MNKTVRSIGNQNTLIVGCGYVGRKVARLQPANPPVSGLVKTKQSALKLQPLGINPLTADLDHPLTTPLQHWSQIYYFAPPPRQGAHDQRMRHFLQALADQPQPIRIVYLGTTGVYGDCAGDWVDENHSPQPRAARALRRLDAEQQLRKWRNNTANEVIFLRVGGIYGPGRLPLTRLRQAKPMLAPEYAPWTNRIHVEDLVQVCVAAMTQGRDGEIYNVSDGQPGNMADYFMQVADAYQLPHPPLIAPDQADDQLSSGLRSYLAESRRIDNRKMLCELQINLKYPTLNTGLAACLAADNH